MILETYFDTVIQNKDTSIRICCYDIEIVKDYLLVGFLPYRGALYQYRIYNKENKFKSNKIKEIRDFVNYLNRQEIYLTAYNNEFDKPILAYIISNEHGEDPDKCIAGCKLIADEIIERREMLDIKRFKYTTAFKSFDAAKTCNLNKPFLKSLKLTLASAKFHNIEEFSFKYNEDIPVNLIPKMEKYNYNDLNGLEHIISKKDNISGLLARVSIDKKYKLFTVNEDNSGMSNRLFPKLYSEATKIPLSKLNNMYTVNQILYPKDIMVPQLSDYRNEKLIKMKADLEKMELPGYDKLKLNYDPFIINGTEYQLGAGGLHSVDTGAIYVEDNDWYIVDIDVNSFYPFIIWLYKFYPKHLGEEFLKVFGDIIQDRIKYKMLKIEDLAYMYKIILNSTFGKMNASFPNWLKDSRAALGTTLNGQLSLLMMVDMATSTKKIDIISANTDGLTCRFHKSSLDLFMKVTQNWMKITGFTLEYKRYKKVFRDSVNSYIVQYYDIYENETNAGLIVKKSIEEGDNNFKVKIKRKGKTMNQFLHDENLYKGLDKPIIAKAVENYFVNNIKPEVTIKEEQDMYLFTSCRKIDKKFKVESTSIVVLDDDDEIDDDEEIKEDMFKNQFISNREEENIVRFYVSKRDDALVLYKTKKVETKKNINKRSQYRTETKIKLLSGSRVSICNNMIVSRVDAIDKYGNQFYQIDYDYYIKEAYMLIGKIQRDDKVKIKKEKEENKQGKLLL